ncbi:MAG TPA: ATP-binding protein [Desulfotomaculum sp.]|nr:ATP-binding protein [Desulfotomaculum sp.]
MPEQMENNLENNKVNNQETPQEHAAKAKPGLIPQNELNEIKQVIAVMSGKGGVGKSLVSALVAVGLKKQGLAVGILDADITGPSIPRMFGLYEQPTPLGDLILPVKSKLGIMVISINLFMPEEDEPVIWRGPLLANVVKQFWKDVAWGKLDYLIVDLPPGTGDVPLTVMQSLPLSGVIVVSSPQDLALMVVRKAIKMTKMMNIPILGFVENMSYLNCPACGEKIHPFGPSYVDEVANKTGLKVIEVLPWEADLTALCDRGEIEEYENNPFTQGNFLSFLEQGTYLKATVDKS